eukprot:COSAG02_NODE_52591_length_307_cov_0.437500_1_plen_62_part_00
MYRIIKLMYETIADLQLATYFFYKKIYLNLKSIIDALDYYDYYSGLDVYPSLLFLLYHSSL